MSKSGDNMSGPDQILPAESFKTSDPDGAVCIFKTEEGLSSEEPVSVYTFVKEAAEKFEEAPAFKIQTGDTFQFMSYREYFNKSCIAAKAMIKLGLERFHGVCIMGSNSPEWMIANFGAIFAGGLSSGIYTTNSVDTCFSIAQNCKAQIAIVEDKSYADKFLSIKEKLPDLKLIVQWSGPSVGGVVMPWDEFMAVGEEEPHEVLQKRLSVAAVNQCCTLIYTSGTTGPPKGVMLSQDQMTWATKQYQRYFKGEPGKEHTLSYLPLSHLAGQLFDIYHSFNYGTTVCFAPKDALKGTFGKVLVEANPTLFIGVPRIWEKIHEKMQEVAGTAGTLVRDVSAWAKGHALNYYQALAEDRKLGTLEWMKIAVARSLVLSRVRSALGLYRCHDLISASAPIDPEILSYFLSLDLPIMEGYGLSESLSFCSMSFLRPGEFKLGSVGKVLGVTTVKLEKVKGEGEEEEEEGGDGDGGEILIKGRNVCMGYLNLPDLTDEAIDEDGWLHTGDLGQFDPAGFLYISGRLKELVITSGGENVPPVLIEAAVKRELSCLSNAVLVGDKRKYLTILLTLKTEVNPETGEPLGTLTPFCQQWVAERGCQATTVEEVKREVEGNPAGKLATEIQAGIERYNSAHAISNAQKVHRFRFLPSDLSLFGGELSSTLKLKRGIVLSRKKKPKFFSTLLNQSVQEM